MTVIRDFYHTVDHIKGLTPATRTADANGATIDRKEFSSAAVYFLIGVSGDTLSGSVKIECEMQHSDNGSDWSACANTDIRADGGAAVTGTNTGTVAVIDDAAEDDVVHVGEYIGSKRYVRGVLNFTGTHTNGCPCAILEFRGTGTYQPSN